jgi:hypothetical protein
MMMFSGATLLLKRKFSASQFWTDTKEQKATGNTNPFMLIVLLVVDTLDSPYV